MKKIASLVVLGVLALSLGACATQPPPPPNYDLTPPPRKPYDPKTQLETGRVR